LITKSLHEINDTETTRNLLLTSIIYLDRYLAKATNQIDANALFNIYTVALSLTLKMWNDDNNIFDDMLNCLADFEFSIYYNSLERFFLKTIDYNLHISENEFNGLILLAIPK
jgi:hypothetical protein